MKQLSRPTVGTDNISFHLLLSVFPIVNNIRPEHNLGFINARASMNEYVKVYVAAKKASAPQLPLREALVTVAVECVYEREELKSKSKRKRLLIRDLLRRRRNTNKVQACTMYSHNEQTAGMTTLADYIDKYDKSRENDNKGKHANVEGTVGNSTLSSITISKILQNDDDDVDDEELNILHERLTSDFLEVESFKPIDVPSIASIDSADNMDDMTMSTYALVGEKNMKKMPSELIITDANNKSGKWWYEKTSRLSPLFFEDPKDAEIFGETNMLKYHTNELKDRMKERKQAPPTIHVRDDDENTLVNAEIDAHSGCMEDMSTIVDSTCMIFCPNGEVFSPDDHDLKLKVDLDTDLNYIDKQKDDKHCNTDRNPNFFHMLDSDDSTRIIFESIDQQDRLFSLLANSTTKPETVKLLLDKHPKTLKMTRITDGRLPLHVLCDFEFPTEDFFSNSTKTIDDILTDCIQVITKYRMLLKLIAWSHIDACSRHDKKGDLPCHLLGHRLMLWTATLQKFILQNHLNMFEIERVTMISNIITECTDIVLRPVETQLNACKSTGSCGAMLPLHVFILFGGSMDVLRSLLETHPEGANTLFKLDGYSPMLPITLLKKIKNDLEQFNEMLTQGSSQLKNPLDWYTTIPSSFYMEDTERRLDLLFCFNPTHTDVNNKRIERIEAVIKSEAKRDKGNWSGQLSPATQRAWIWMCARYKHVEEREICDECVDRILRSLQPTHISRLLNVKTEGGEKLGFARPRVRKRVLEAASGISSEGSQTLHRLRLAPNIISTQSKMSSICKSIFAVQENNIPVFFVVFPFSIEPSSDRQNMLVAESNAILAVEFSNFMLHETSPEIILKSIGHKIQSQDNLILTRRDDKESETTERLLSKIYRKGAWLYFIDGQTGAPITKGAGKEKYPIPLTNPAKQVALLLPLMRMGMILMRKSQNVTILSKVLLQSMASDCTIPKAVSSWPTAAQEMIDYITNSLEHHQQTTAGTVLDRELNTMRNGLYKFQSWHDQEDRDDTMGYRLTSIDWSLEITLLQFILETKGLTASNIEEEVGIERRQSLTSDRVLWTAPRPRSAIGEMGRRSRSQNLTKVEEILKADANDDREASMLRQLSAAKTKMPGKIGDSNISKEIVSVAEMEQKLSYLRDFLNSNDKEDSRLKKKRITQRKSPRNTEPPVNI